MVKTIEIIEKISNSNFVNEHLPLEVQLGIPYPELLNNKLSFVFLPHKEKHHDGKTEIFPSSYKLVYAYPFDKIVEYRNLAFGNDVKAQKSVYISDKMMLSLTICSIEDLYKEYDNILALAEETGNITEVMVKRCQKKFNEVIEQNGLAPIYSNRH